MSRKIATAYKFMKRAHLPLLIEQHTIRIGNLEYYRNMEGPAWIADSKEGSRDAFMPGPLVIRPGSQHSLLRHNLSQVGFYVGPNAQATFNVSSTMAIANVHIFCASLPPFAPVAKAMCVDAPPDYRYDACVEISDWHQFCLDLQHTGTVVELDHKRLVEAFQGSDMAPVKYTRRSIDLSSDLYVAPHPMEKDPVFSAQQEVRFAWASEPALLAPTLTVKFKPTATYFREVPVPTGK